MKIGLFDVCYDFEVCMFWYNFILGLELLKQFSFYVPFLQVMVVSVTQCKKKLSEKGKLSWFNLHCRWNAVIQTTKVDDGRIAKEG